MASSSQQFADDWGSMKVSPLNLDTVDGDLETKQSKRSSWTAHPSCSSHALKVGNLHRCLAAESEFFCATSGGNTGNHPLLATCSRQNEERIHWGYAMTNSGSDFKRFMVLDVLFFTTKKRRDILQ